MYSERVVEITAREYDVVVAGGGIAGAIAAASAAKNGAKTVLLDRNVSNEVGKKTNWGWVCGEACAKSHIDFLRERLGINLTEPVLDVRVDGVYALSPDLQSKQLFEGEGYCLDRPKLARKLVDEAVKQGAEFRQGCEVEGPIFEGDELAGVFGKDEKKQDLRITGKIIIDCLGMASTLRRKLPANSFVDRDVRIEDIESTGRYIVKFKPATEDLTYYDKDNAVIHLNQEWAPGGYGWVFPRSGSRVNIGIGIEKNSLDKRNAKMNRKDSLQKLLDDYVALNPVVKDIEMDNTDNNAKGFWSVSVRRQQDSLVYMNYMGAGDSVSMPNPVSAGGIGPAMISGTLAGEIAAKAVAENQVNMKYLWSYNRQYVEAYGAKCGALEVFRVYLQSLNNDMLNYGMKHFVTPEEAEDLAYGRFPKMSLSSKLHKIISGMGNMSAFRNLLFTVDKMKKLLELYQKYPEDIAAFPAWKQRISDEINEAKSRLPPNPV